MRAPPDRLIEGNHVAVGRRASLHLGCLVAAVLALSVACAGSSGHHEPLVTNPAAGPSSSAGEPPALQSGRPVVPRRPSAPLPSPARPAPPVQPAQPGHSGAPGPTAPPDHPVNGTKPRVIAWLSDFGPLGGGAGGKGDGRLERVDAYNGLAKDDCEQIAPHLKESRIYGPSLSLYEGAVSACLSAFHHRPDLWARAVQGLTAAQRSTARFDCIDMAVYRFLRALVEAHHQAPDAQFVKAPTSQGGPCPRITEVIPARGPPQGGYQVRVVGVNLPRQAGIHFGDHYFAVSTEDGREALVTVPRAAGVVAPRLVEVWVDGWPFQTGHAVCCYGPNNAFFIYEREPPRRTPSAGTPPSRTR